jgi:PAS domain S-box-containing protein
MGAGLYDKSISFDKGLFFMNDEGKTREQLIAELAALRKHLAEEGALKNSSREIRDLYHNAPCGYHSLNPDGLFVRINDRELEWLGYAREEIIDIKTLCDILTPASQAVFRKTFPVLKKQGWIKNVELDLVRKDGSILPVLVNATAVMDEKGDYVMSRSTVTDMTELKRTEAQLRRSEEKYRGIVENISEGYMEIDLQGNRLFCNEPLLRMSGYTREEFMKRSYRNQEDAESVKRVRAKFNEMYRTGEALKWMPFKMKRKDGSICHVEFSSTLIRDVAGNPVGFRTVSRDITERVKLEEERKRLEEQLYKAQKMEAVGTLAGGIAHDFNNLLMGIQGFASLMLLNMEPGHDQYDKLKAIECQIQSGANLTKQLLGFARGGRYELKPADMSALVRNAVQMFGRTKKEIRIHEKYPDTLWRAKVDQGQIEQVLLNLFVNAWQAMPGGGELYVETQNVALDESYSQIFTVVPGKYVKISVTDTGVGMDEKTRERIFDPFFTTKEMGRGTGLGLATVYGIVKGHKGIINVYSEKGQGTTFNIYLPALEGHAVAAAKPAEVAAVNGKETILIVDDEGFILAVVEELLKSLGYRVYKATNGEEAVKIYRENEGAIDLVIVDMVMPGLSGGDTFDLLKKINPEIKVILSSGYSQNGAATSILDRGCRAFIQKPFSLRDLSTKVREVLDHPEEA